MEKTFTKQAGEIISVEDFIVIVDKNQKAKGGEWEITEGLLNYVSDDVDADNKVIATIGKQLEGVPLVVLPDEENLETLAVKSALREEGGQHYTDAHYRGFKKGYKAANKQYSEEDIKEALRVGVNIGMGNLDKPRFENDFNFNQEKAIQDCKDYIQSLQPKQSISSITLSYFAKCTHAECARTECDCGVNQPELQVDPTTNSIHPLKVEYEGS